MTQTYAPSRPMPVNIWRELDIQERALVIKTIPGFDSAWKTAARYVMVTGLTLPITVGVLSTWIIPHQTFLTWVTFGGTYGVNYAVCAALGWATALLLGSPLLAMNYRWRYKNGVTLSPKWYTPADWSAYRTSQPMNQTYLDTLDWVKAAKMLARARWIPSNPPTKWANL